MTSVSPGIYRHPKTVTTRGAPFDAEAVVRHWSRTADPAELKRWRRRERYKRWLWRSACGAAESIKRSVDVGVGAGALLALSPALAATAAAIRVEDGGPIFFRQQRVGRSGRRFWMWKFRSMRVDAEAVRENLAEDNQHGTEGVTFKMKEDPRVTRVGRFIRKYSIDELPQLINVLRGDMSLVGPRPPLPHEVARYRAWQLRRLRVKPGITCLWQVGGRSEIDFEGQVRLDLDYIASESLREDLRILLKTIPAVLSGRGAY